MSEMIIHIPEGWRRLEDDEIIGMEDKFHYRDNSLGDFGETGFSNGKNTAKDGVANFEGVDFYITKRPVPHKDIASYW
jgi:hypothetical protein